MKQTFKIINRAKKAYISKWFYYCAHTVSPRLSLNLLPFKITRLFKSYKNNTYPVSTLGCVTCSCCSTHRSCWKRWHKAQAHKHTAHWWPWGPPVLQCRSPVSQPEQHCHLQHSTAQTPCVPQQPDRPGDIVTGQHFQHRVPKESGCAEHKHWPAAIVALHTSNSDLLLKATTETLGQNSPVIIPDLVTNMTSFNAARDRTRFGRKAGAVREIVCKKDAEKQEGSHWPRRIMEDPAKPVSGTKWTESKPRKKIKGGSHIRTIIRQYSINNDTKSSRYLPRALQQTLGYLWADLTALAAARSVTPRTRACAHTSARGSSSSTAKASSALYKAARSWGSSSRARPRSLTTPRTANKLFPLSTSYQLQLEASWGSVCCVPQHHLFSIKFSDISVFLNRMRWRGVHLIPTSHQPTHRADHQQLFLPGEKKK